MWIWTCLGNKIVSEQEVCEKAEKEAWFLTKRTELINVFYLEKNQWTITDVFVDAILNALVDARMTVEDIDWIFVSTSWAHWDKIISLSSILATRLWLNKKKHVIAKDINSACVWFGDALDTAFQRLKNDGPFNHKNYIVVAGDNLWSWQRKSDDIKTWMFSDGVWCMIISNNPDFSSDMKIKQTASGLSKGVNTENIFAISQPEWEKLWMNDGKALSASLLHTADEIFSLLNIKKLDNWTLIIPHQPNNRMLQKWKNNSEVISAAQDKWLAILGETDETEDKNKWLNALNIKIHNETYKTMWNVSWACVLFGLQKAVKEWLLPKWCKHIILTPFGAWWHLAWAEIDYENKWESKILWIIPQPWAKEYAKYSKIAYESNEKLFWADAPISYKKNISWRLVPSILSESGLSWFLPQSISIDKLVSSVDVFHWQVLVSIYPNKEFVTKRIYYELPKVSKEDSSRIPTFYANDAKVSWNLTIDSIEHTGTTKSWKNIYRVVTLKDSVKIISEFCEIDPVPSQDTHKYKDISEQQKWADRVISSDDVNIHWSIWWYISSTILLEDQIPESATIEFISWAKYWDKISIKKLHEVDSSIKFVSKYTKDEQETIFCIVNEDTKSLVATLAPNTKLYEDIKEENSRYLVGIPW